MKSVSTLAAIVLIVSSLVRVSPANADELVEVAPHRAALPSASSDHTPPLLGFLTRPPGPGRFPAVVLLHWCSGFSTHDTNAAETLKYWGFVALTIDSLGDANMCQAIGGAASEKIDAYSALHYLAAQDFVAADRVVVMGYSMGALAALDVVEKAPLVSNEQMHFRAAIAYYPPCQYATGDLTAPTLILIGDHDDWSSPDGCRKLAAGESDIGITRTPGQGAPVDLVVYPGATHSFDSDHPPHYYLGHFLRYDPAATEDAERKVHAFLRASVGGSHD